MPAVTAGTTDAIEVYRSKTGTLGRPSRLIARVAPDSNATLTWAKRPGVTAVGTDDATDGVYTLSSEVFNDDMIAGDTWYVISDTADTKVYYEVNGAV